MVQINCWEDPVLTTVRIWFTKTGEAAYISLLDLQRVMQRSLKRSAIPVWYTMGFNPHIYMTFACPLPLGQESLVESVDIKTEVENIPTEEWKEALNKVMPRGIQVTKVSKVNHKADEIAFAKYIVRFPKSAEPCLKAYNSSETAIVLKKTKRGHKEIDLKEHLKMFDYQEKDGCLETEVLLPAGEGLNLNPSLWLNFMQENCGLNATEVSVLRVALLLKTMQDFD